MDISGSNLNTEFTLNQLLSNQALNNVPENPPSSDSNSVGEALNSFGNLLQNELEKVNTLQAQANDAVELYAVGGNIELHNVILAVEKANMSLQLTTQIRNKLIDAYREINRMQI